MQLRSGFRRSSARFLPAVRTLSLDTVLRLLVSVTALIVIDNKIDELCQEECPPDNEKAGFTGFFNYPTGLMVVQQSTFQEVLTFRIILLVL